MTTLFGPHMIDFYKSGHHRQYPEGTTLVVSNFTPRHNQHANVPGDGITFFGLRYMLEDFLEKSWGAFFRMDKSDAIGKYRRRMDGALGPGAVTPEHLEALHDLRYLPIQIRALPEGTYVPMGTPALTVHNTLPAAYWLTNYIESALSEYLWLPCTSATTARAYRRLLEGWAIKTGGDPSFVDFQGHDFSSRGMAGPQAAVMSGAGHLLYFKGTDTVSAIDFIEDYYHGHLDGALIGGSIPATEHSVMCMGGAGDDERETIRRLITEIYPTGPVSIVSDTWDFWRVLTEYAHDLTPEIMARDGKLVFRPDSGDPVKILCGDPGARPGSPVHKGAVECLWDRFGGSMTHKGYKLLDSHVGLIYGDAITYARAQAICEGLASKGFATTNPVLGIGSYTYQYVTRDTWGFAMKATYGVVNGESRDLYKSPKTDVDGHKQSHKGLLFVRPDLTVEQGVTWERFISPENALKPVWTDGMLDRGVSFAQVRETARAHLAVPADAEML